MDFMIRNIFFFFPSDILSTFNIHLLSLLCVLEPTIGVDIATQ